MNVFSQLIKARLEHVAGAISETVSGIVWLDTAADRFKFRNNSGSAKEVVDTDTAQALSNKTLTGNTAANLRPDGVAIVTIPVATDTLVGRATTDTLANKTLTSPVINTPEIDVVTVSHQSTPSTPAAGKVKMYIKNTNKLFLKDSSGTERPVGSGGGGGGSLSWEKIGVLSPENVSQDGIRLEGFAQYEDQEMYLTCNVPSDYVAGTQIKLQGAAFFISSVAGKVRFRAQTALLRAENTTLGTYSNIHTSINSEVTVAGSSNQLTNVGDIDLTDTLGQVNGVAVAPGDKLRVRLYRNVAGETSVANSTAKLMINNMEIKFST